MMLSGRQRCTCHDEVSMCVYPCMHVHRRLLMQPEIASDLGNTGDAERHRGLWTLADAVAVPLHCEATGTAMRPLSRSIPTEGPTQQAACPCGGDAGCARSSERSCAAWTPVCHTAA